MWTFFCTETYRPVLIPAFFRLRVTLRFFAIKIAAAVQSAHTPAPCEMKSPLPQNFRAGDEIHPRLHPEMDNVRVAFPLEWLSTPPVRRPALSLVPWPPRDLSAQPELAVSPTTNRKEPKYSPSRSARHARSSSAWPQFRLADGSWKDDCPEPPLAGAAGPDESSICPTNCDPAPQAAANLPARPFVREGAPPETTAAPAAHGIPAWP